MAGVWSPMRIHKLQPGQKEHVLEGEIVLSWASFLALSSWAKINPEDSEDSRFALFDLKERLMGRS